MIEILSITLAIVSIILGIFAIIDSRIQGKKNKKNLDLMNAAIDEIKGISTNVERELDVKTDAILSQLDDKIMEIIRRQFPTLDEKSSAREKDLQTDLTANAMGSFMQNPEMQKFLLEMMRNEFKKK
ncbi:MAG: hypothetical protein WBV93_08760 [Anaerobacillus sp.]